MEQWYFAYGSNLLSDQMVARTGLIRRSNERPQIAHLPNYRLAFNALGEDGCVYANITQPGEGVFGVIYRCGQEALEKLDVYESEYERQVIAVINNVGIELRAVAYIALPEKVTKESRPGAAYLQKILTGARAQGLPEEYIRAIEATALGFSAR
jgi:gamma-glutamylcyclotransferase